MRSAWIVSIGSELTLGQSVDTNAPWLAAQLAAQGIRCRRQVTVPDELEALSATFREAAAASDLVVATGGLGPTADDLTRQALAAAAGLPLELDAPSLEQIRAFFARRGREMPSANRVQALLPKGARPLPNTCGTAVGICLELAGTPCYALPGVPFEMREMFRREVLPHLPALGDGQVVRFRRLHCFGTSESAIGEALADLMRPGRNPAVGTTAELGVITVRINASADSPAAAEALLDDTERLVRARLGTAVFGRDGETLASVVGALLAARGQTLGTAESCTGGLIAKLLTDVPGSSAYYLGGAVSYANELKEALVGVPGELLTAVGAVSEPVARAMAEGARRAFGSSFALATTGIAGPTGGTPDKPVGLVFLALAGPQQTRVEAARFGSESPRVVIRERAARTALDLLRRELIRQGP